MDHRARDLIIIGGGIAGLAAARRGRELGLDPLLIEAGSYPAHRVCGEFFSPESLPHLERWGLAPENKIHKTTLFAGSRQISFDLPSPAGACSRHSFDAALSASIGGDLLTETRVTKVDRGDGYVVTLESGEELRADQLIVGAGRVAAPGQPPPKLLYSGLKMHFEGIELENHLEMYTFTGGYLGLANVEEGRTNLACLSRKPVANPSAFLARVHPRLGEHFASATPLFDEWMEVRAPAFGPRNPPIWPNAYFVGDAAGTIAPACGDGLAMALTSGIMAAEYAVERRWEAFRKDWKKRYSRRLRYGHLLHELMMRPHLAHLAAPLCKLLPFHKLAFRLTRESHHD